MRAAPWLFAPSSDWLDASIVLPEEESHHAAHVLRLGVGARVAVTDGRGAVAHCTITACDGGRVVAAIDERHHHETSTPQVVVYQAAAKGTRVDDVVDRLAQLGAAETSVFSCRRSVVRWDERKQAALAERWRARARAAAKQSRSPFLMTSGLPLSWSELRERVGREERALVLWERATEPLRAAIDDARRIALVVGPEGGLTEEEVSDLEAVGAQPVSLGPRILRTENAAAVAASAVLFHHGLIG